MSLPGLEIWGGVECTYNRVRDQYFDQVRFSGHDGREDDLDRFAELGIRVLRYPVLWEKIAPEGLARADWSWTDRRLARLRELGIRPIAGLVHHGSGPRYTRLDDPAFPEKLAAFAAKAAERYPWVESYTPVNEPLTTARFSGLYGFWYPHAADDQTFLRCLIHECRGTVLSMRAIRAVQPAARLVQTEDLGRTTSTPLLAYQAELENERRWLSLDLLCGRVDRGHPLWSYFMKTGIPPAALEWFLENPCPPDLIGINHYLTSNRHLDERLERYPAHYHGGNGVHRYADVEAVRVGEAEPADRKSLLREAWRCYGLPLAVTESHLNSTREEQLRWLKEIWDTGQELRREGVDFRAVTVWSLLGAFDWICLVTRCEGHYEPGAFDLRSQSPRPTALAEMLQALAQGRDFRHPLLAVPGRWKLPVRSLYPPAAIPDLPVDDPESPPLLITGGNGTLGRAFARICRLRGIPHRLVTRRDVDIARPAEVGEVLDRLRPWAIVNAAGYVRVDEAEKEIERCCRENVTGPEVLASQAAARGIPFVTFSSDLVFDGALGAPYRESHPVRPINIYGRSKAHAEKIVLDHHPRALVIRTSAFFGPWDDYNFLTISLNHLAQGRSVAVPEDVVVSPTYVPDLVHAVLDLLVDGEKGIWHLANQGETTWAEFARSAARLAGIGHDRIQGVPVKELSWPAPRPLYSALGSERGQLLPSLDKAVERYVSEAAHLVALLARDSGPKEALA